MIARQFSFSCRAPLPQAATPLPIAAILPLWGQLQAAVLWPVTCSLDYGVNSELNLS